MKKQRKKLRLSRETLRRLGGNDLGQARGAAQANGDLAADAAFTLFELCRTYFSNCWECQSNVISVCLGCTTPLDTCPDPTYTIA